MAALFDLFRTGLQTVMAGAASFGSENNPMFEIVEISPNETNVEIVSRENNGFAYVFKYRSSDILHVCIRWKGNGKNYSVYRERRQALVDENFKKFVTEQHFLNTIDTDFMFKEAVDLIHRHPKWNSIHYASALGHEEYFLYIGISGNIDFRQLVNSTPDDEPLFPLHIASQNGRSGMVKRLLDLGASVAAVDANSMNCFHHAATNNDPDTIMALGKALNCRDSVNNENLNGYTPLYLCLANTNLNPDSVLAFMQIGASVKVKCQGRSVLFHMVESGQINPKFQECFRILLESCPEAINEIDEHTGNTIFHVTKEAQILNLLFRVPGSNVDVVNRSGKTPLLVQMEEGNLDCFIKLLSYNASTEARDPTNLHNTPLHTAITKGYLDFVKTLLIFGADVSATNDNGDLPLHLAALSSNVAKRLILSCLETVDAPRCLPGKLGTSPCNNDCKCKPLQNDNLLQQHDAESLNEFAQLLAISTVDEKKRRKIRVQNLLSLDGGGIRGLILIQILLHIEKRLNCNILSKFHWIAGTSTGAILSAALCSGHSLKECQRLYFRFKDDVFGGVSRRPYSSAVIETFLQDELGPTKTMADVKDCKLIITAVEGNISPLKLWLFRSYQLPLSSAENLKMGYEDPASCLLWRAARCSSAAPTYFTAVDDKFIDGGLIANNPTLDLLTEVLNYNTALKFQNKNQDLVELGCVLSVGTGRTPEVASKGADRLCFPNGFLEAAAAVLQFKDVGKMLIEQVTESEGRPVDRSRAVLNAMGVPYFRFSTHLKSEIGLDETNNKKLIDGLWQTLEYLHKSSREVNLLIELLK